MAAAEIKTPAPTFLCRRPLSQATVVGMRGKDRTQGQLARVAGHYRNAHKPCGAEHGSDWPPEFVSAAAITRLQRTAAHRSAPHTIAPHAPLHMGLAPVHLPIPLPIHRPEHRRIRILRCYQFCRMACPKYVRVCARMLPEHTCLWVAESLYEEDEKKNFGPIQGSCLGS